METLTKEEQETFKILLRLGDSKELALKTVISERLTNKDYEMSTLCYLS